MKNQPNAKSRPRVTRSFFAPFGRSSRAASAGLSVRLLIALKIVLNAIVSANCR